MSVQLDHYPPSPPFRSRRPAASGRLTAVLTAAVLDSPAFVLLLVFEVFITGRKKRNKSGSGIELWFGSSQTIPPNVTKSNGRSEPERIASGRLPRSCLCDPSLSRLVGFVNDLLEARAVSQGNHC